MLILAALVCGRPGPMQPCRADLAWSLSLGGISFPGYIALWSVLANIVVAIVLSLAFAPFERVKPRRA